MSPICYPASWSCANYRFAQRIGLFDRNVCAATLCARRRSVRLTDFTIASFIQERGHLFSPTFLQLTLRRIRGVL
jgi:hypothetical protein